MSTVNLNASGRRSASDDRVDSLFTARWSPRAMTGEPLLEDELAPLFEAARWAPSSMNAQPWRFVYASKGDKHWQTFYDLMAEGNQKWAVNAGALLVVASSRKMGERDSVTHSFDTGAAWMSLALQAHKSGLVAHGMQGFDYEAAARALHIPATFRVEAMIALGKPGDVDTLPEGYGEREKPSDRKPLNEIVFHGTLAAPA
ncbi:MAG: nitroreductase family protein [Pseudomonadales bacterium]